MPRYRTGVVVLTIVICALPGGAAYASPKTVKEGSVLIKTDPERLTERNISARAVVVAGR